MLSLTRKEGEIINIGDDITVTVQAIGIEAPREVPVHRQEVAQRIRENAEI